MTDQEILQKAVAKAAKAAKKAKNFKPDQYVPMIFSHDFAKAFWGEQEAIFSREPLKEHYQSRRFGSLGRVLHLSDWQFHLQQMVLEEEPLKYLEKFLKEDI